jgi:A/G-specific adenine glycosylase
MVRPAGALKKFSVKKPQDLEVLRASLLAWYDRTARSLPWRIAPADRRQGRIPDPYKVWLSEIMLQQTTVVTVGPYYQNFLARWPAVKNLAAATEDQVLHAWQGLGYYARARNLHACAKEIAKRKGVWPKEEAELLTLPGVGPYTAAAIAAIAFDQTAVPVDGNVERVMARLFAVMTPLPAAKSELRDRARSFAFGARPGDFAQAVMDLGATVCTPRQPKCSMCPWQKSCQAYALGLAADVPRRAAKTVKPTRYGYVFWLISPEGKVWVRRRSSTGLLGGMMEFPSTPWATTQVSPRKAQSVCPLATPFLSPWELMPGTVRHVFTHFTLELRVLKGWVSQATADEKWVKPDYFSELALPSLMKKVAQHAIGSSSLKPLNASK